MTNTQEPTETETETDEAAIIDREFDALLAYLDDHRADFEQVFGPEDGDPPGDNTFVTGLRHAQFLVRQFQLGYSAAAVECCPDGPAPEEYTDGSWQCSNCGAVLADATEGTDD